MSTKSARARRGVTLGELLVALTILGIMTGVSAVAFSRARRSVSPTSARDSTRAAIVGRIDRARRQAIREARIIVVAYADGSSAVSAAVLPDGSVVADSSLGRIAGWDRLAGRAVLPTGNRRGGFDARR